MGRPREGAGKGVVGRHRMVPGALVDGAPVGLSIIGARGSDASLVAVAQAMEAAS